MVDHSLPLESFSSLGFYDNTFSKFSSSLDIPFRSISHVFMLLSTLQIRDHQESILNSVLFFFLFLLHVLSPNLMASTHMHLKKTPKSVSPAETSLLTFRPPEQAKAY